MLKILLEHEYGLAYYCWRYNGTKQQLIKDFREGKFPTDDYFYRTKKGISFKKAFNGSVKKISTDEVEVHHLNPKYDGLWVKGTGKMAEEERSKVFNSKEYKALQAQFTKDLDEKWPVRCHVFYDDNYLIVDGNKYKPNEEIV